MHNPQSQLSYEAMLTSSLMTLGLHIHSTVYMYFLVMIAKVADFRHVPGSHTVLQPDITFLMFTFHPL